MRGHPGGVRVSRRAEPAHPDVLAAPPMRKSSRASPLPQARSHRQVREQGSLLQVQRNSSASAMMWKITFCSSVPLK